MANNGSICSTTTTTSSSNAINPMSLVETPQLRFLICDSPNDDNLPLYIQEFRKYNVKHVVRACDPTYEQSKLEAEGFIFHQLAFKDGAAPPEAHVREWIDIVCSVFPPGKAPSEAIGIHCVAGLGRAPIMVAIALIEHGMQPLEAVEFIRQRRRGALNVTQLQYIKSYKAHILKKPCLVM